MQEIKKLSKKEKRKELSKAHANLQSLTGAGGAYYITKAGLRDKRKVLQAHQKGLMSAKSFMLRERAKLLKSGKAITRQQLNSIRSKSKTKYLTSMLKSGFKQGLKTKSGKLIAIGAIATMTALYLKKNERMKEIDNGTDNSNNKNIGIKTIPIGSKNGKWITYNGRRLFVKK